jgi:hypothetical protein
VQDEAAGHDGERQQHAGGEGDGGKLLHEEEGAQDGRLARRPRPPTQQWLTK